MLLLERSETGVRLGQAIVPKSLIFACFRSFHVAYQFQIPTVMTQPHEWTTFLLLSLLTFPFVPFYPIPCSQFRLTIVTHMH